MTITLELPAALERRLQTKAARKGMSLDRYIIQDLDDEAELVESGPLPEAELLKRIKPDLGIPAVVWSRYHQLIKQRQAERLTPYEYEELIALNDEMEEANVQRIKYLIELATLRGTSLEQVMLDLDIRPRALEDE